MISMVRPALLNITPTTKYVRINVVFTGGGPRASLHSSSRTNVCMNHIRSVLTRHSTSYMRLKNNLNEKLSLMGFIFAHQCNFYAAQRARRLSQIWNLYSKLYKDKNVKNLVKKLKNAFVGRNKPAGLLLGATFFSWDKNIITDLDLER